jgi:hypothetical protein
VAALQLSRTGQLPRTGQHIETSTGYRPWLASVLAKAPAITARPARLEWMSSYRVHIQVRVQICATFISEQQRDQGGPKALTAGEGGYPLVSAAPTCACTCAFIRVS